MTFLYILCGLLGLLLLLLIVAALRAAANKAKQPARLAAAAVDETRANAYAKTLGDMIRVETISEPQQGSEKFLRFHALIETLFPLLHKNTEKVNLDGSLLFRWKGSGNEPPILFMSHMDVVEASGTWQHPPFSGDIADGKLWGRGTLDTKGSLFAILQAAEELMAEGFCPKGDIYIASGRDEEVGGAGSQATAEYLKEQGVKLALLVDEGGMVLDTPMPGVNGTFAMVGVLEKGYGDLKFTAKAPGGHASVQHKNTPLARLAKLIVDVENHDPFTPHLNGTVTEMFRRLAPYMNFSMRLIFSNMWLFRPVLARLLSSYDATLCAMMKTTVSFTMAKGSDGHNVVPNTAYVTANLRFSPEQPRDVSIEIMRRIAAKYDLTTEVLLSNEVCRVVPHESAAFARVEAAVQQVFPGVVTTPYAMSGATDARHYSDVCDNLLRISPIISTNEQLNTIHSYDENIDVSALPAAVDFFKYLARNQ